MTTMILNTGRFEEWYKVCIIALKEKEIYVPSSPIAMLNGRLPLLRLGICRNMLSRPRLAKLPSIRFRSLVTPSSSQLIPLSRLCLRSPAVGKSLILQSFRCNSSKTVPETSLPSASPISKGSAKSAHAKEQSKTDDYKDIIRLFMLAKRDWKLLLTAILLLTISCSIGMSIPKVIGIVLDTLKTSSGSDFFDLKIPIFSLPLYEFLSFFTVALLIGCAANFGRFILLRILSERVVARLRANVIKKTLHQDAEFFDNHKVGDLISRLGSDAYVVSRSMTQKVSDGVKALICGVVGVGMMCSLSPQLSILLLFFTPPVLFSASVFGKQIRNTSKDLQEATGQLTRVAEEQLSGIKTVQSFVAEGNELSRYNVAIRDIFQVGKTAAFTNAKFFTTTSLLGDLSFLTVLAYGSYLVLQSQLSIGDLTAFMLYTEYTGNAVFGLSTFYSEIMQGAGAASRLFELTDRKPSISPTVGHKYKPDRGVIEFKDVSFSYPTRPSVQIFKNLNFKIAPGSSVCIVGPSGRGKSTIALLLLRYYNPTTGTITIDNQDISKLNCKSLRRHIGIVQQEPVLMSGTIRDNITYGLTYTPTKEEIRSVAKQCFCHNFITKFPNTYDTVIGPHGTLLSGGQKQRIAIARALIKKPTILILDEATSALDVESEGAINYTFGQLMKSKSLTIVSIAHRLSTIRRSENVIVLGHDGSVVEMGKFKELYANPTSALSQLLNEKAAPGPSDQQLQIEKVIEKEDLNESKEHDDQKKDDNDDNDNNHDNDSNNQSPETKDNNSDDIEKSVEHLLKDAAKEANPIKITPQP